jgi:hypothetical protein
VIAAQTARQFRALAALITLAALVSLALATPGSAAKNLGKRCGDLVVADWYDNGRVDFIYPLRCYRQAIRSLPPDVKDYSSAKDEIERALQDASTRPPVAAAIPLEEAPPPCKGNKKNCKKIFTPPSNGTPTTTAEGETVAKGPDTSGPSSVPIPLIVLGGLSLLLLAAGSAGYLARRFGNRGGGDGDEPPAAV